MAINRHDPEWKRIVGMAALGGCTFMQSCSGRRCGRPPLSILPIWYVELPDGRRRMGWSKLEVAKIALAILGVAEFLPDAATPRTARSGPERTTRAGSEPATKN